VSGIDRTVIGRERWGRHPVNPFEVKRHGEKPIVPVAVPEPITPMVNGTFASLPHLRHVFDKISPRSIHRIENSLAR
jgi:hypothetical protein